MDKVDQIARDLAQQALSAIATHEQVCAERAKNAEGWRATATESFERIEKSISGIYSQMWIAVGGLATAMFAVIIMLIEDKLK